MTTETGYRESSHFLGSSHLIHPVSFHLHHLSLISGLSFLSHSLPAPITSARRMLVPGSLVTSLTLHSHPRSRGERSVAGMSRVRWKGHEETGSHGRVLSLNRLFSPLHVPSRLFTSGLRPVSFPHPPLIPFPSGSVRRGVAPEDTRRKG